MHNPKDRYRQLKSALTKAKIIEDLLPASVYFTIKSVHSLNQKNKVCCHGPTGVLFYTQDNDFTHRNAGATKKLSGERKNKICLICHNALFQSFIFQKSYSESNMKAVLN